MRSLILILCVCASFMFSGCEEDIYKKFKSKVFESSLPTLEQPSISKDEVFPGQFQGEDGPFVLVSEPSALYWNTASDPKRRGSLKVSQRVRVLFRKPHPTVDSPIRGHWAFLASEDGRVTLGWTDDAALAYPGSFSPYQWDYGRFKYEKGMFSGTILPRSGGGFTVTWVSTGNGLYLKGRYGGLVMSFGDLIWLKKDFGDEFYDFFYINFSTDEILTELKYRTAKEDEFQIPALQRR